LASAHGIRSLAFPSLSTGAYGYPLREAAAIALKTTIAYLKAHPPGIELVRFVLFGQEAYETFQGALEEVTPRRDQAPGQ
jgi:O-acetyl-ADP-ribose deacetylase (regulator of RNase III)